MQGHDAMLASILKIESVTFEPTKCVEPEIDDYEIYADAMYFNVDRNNPNNSRNVISFTVPPELCSMSIRFIRHTKFDSSLSHP
jgi:hypothetical protein